MKAITLFDEHRLTWQDAVELTAESLRAHAITHRHWCIAWSGGKDSSTLLTVVMYLIESGRLPRPERITVCYADTRMEIPPLALAAQVIITELRERGVEVRIVMAPLDQRFFVYMLGRGVPPPNNNTMRWCTAQIKVEPMEAELHRIIGEAGSDVLMLTGVRQGESAIRDGRIAMSCGVNGAECGQGWYQQMKGAGFATLAPILHWRVCHVWDWLKLIAPRPKHGAWHTALIADAYGGDEAEEINARTGCICCPLASKDTALDAVIAMEEWSHCRPLKGLKAIYRELRHNPAMRLRMPPGERRKDGTLAANQNRKGPLTLEARRWALAEIVNIQAQCNSVADHRGLPRIDIINDEEIARIKELIDANTWPDKWTGDEPRADEPYCQMHADGSLQPLLFQLEGTQS